MLDISIHFISVKILINAELQSSGLLILSFSPFFFPSFERRRASQRNELDEEHRQLRGMVSSISAALGSAGWARAHFPKQRLVIEPEW